MRALDVYNGVVELDSFLIGPTCDARERVQLIGVHSKTSALSELNPARLAALSLHVMKFGLRPASDECSVTRTLRICVRCVVVLVVRSARHMRVSLFRRRCVVFPLVPSAFEKAVPVFSISPRSRRRCFLPALEGAPEKPSSGGTWRLPKLCQPTDALTSISLKFSARKTCCAGLGALLFPTFSIANPCLC